MTAIDHISVTTAARRRSYSVRTHVSAIIALVLVPALIVAGALAAQWAKSAQERIQERAAQEAREIVGSIDRQIAGIQDMLIALGSSPSLRAGDLRAFYDQAVELSARLNVQIVLRDPYRDRQLLNTAFALGSTTASGAAPTVREAEQKSLRSGRPEVSGVIFGTLVKRHLVVVMVPVVINGVTYFLTVGLPADSLANILGQSQMDDSWVAILVDRSEMIVARSRGHNEFVGTKILNSPPVELPSVTSGTNREGTAFHWFNRQSETTGWIVSIGVPDTVLHAPWKLAFTTFAAASCLLSFAAFGLSRYWGRHLAASAGALGIDRKPTREEFQVLFDSAPNGVLVIDREGLIVLSNARANMKFGYHEGELIGKSIESLIPPRLRGEHAGLQAEVTAALEGRPMVVGRELYGLRKDGVELPVEIGLSPIMTTAGSLIMATVIDITARKRAEARISRAEAERDDLRRRLMQAQEQERLRLARELHDQTGQSLTAALLESKAIEPLVQENERYRVRSLRERLEDIGKTLHRVAWELRPASLDDLGLANALTTYVAEWGAKYGVETDFHCADDHLDEERDELRTTVYRVTQEALTNIAKHASGATSVSVVIERVNESLRLMVDDNGCGYDPAAQANRNGLGIAGMRERLSLVGGELQIETAEGIGTTIFARIPVASARHA